MVPASPSPSPCSDNMRLSLKFHGEDEKHEHSTQIMTAKVPITIFNKPFASGVTATTGFNSPSEFSFSLSTNFSSGPSLKLSYSPTASLPFSLSLKSGLGLLGSPAHSPLVFSANLSLSPTHSSLPSFFLHFKPQFGHFSLHKTLFSHSNTQSLSLPSTTPFSPEPDNSHVPNTFVSDQSSSGWHNLKLEPCGDQIQNSLVVKKNDAKYGVRVMARTVMPVARGFYLNFRWGVNLPRNFGSKMPSLTVNKIRLDRIEEGKENGESNSKQRKDSSESDLNLLKGMWFWMGRDLENMERENREMKRVLDEMKMGVSNARNNQREVNNGGGRKLGEGSGEFERWRSNRNGRQEDEKKVQPNKSQSVVSDVESELQKAIKAATS